MSKSSKFHKHFCRTDTRDKSIRAPRTRSAFSKGLFWKLKVKASPGWQMRWSRHSRRAFLTVLLSIPSSLNILQAMFTAYLETNVRVRSVSLFFYTIHVCIKGVKSLNFNVPLSHQDHQHKNIKLYHQFSFTASRLTYGKGKSGYRLLIGRNSLAVLRPHEKTMQRFCQIKLRKEEVPAVAQFP